MIFIGEYNDLKVDRETSYGFYLEDEEKFCIITKGLFKLKQYQNRRYYYYIYI